MNLENAIIHRHSVRNYTEEPIQIGIREKIEEEVKKCNIEGDLNISVVWDNPSVFSNFLTHYGKFTGVRNYFILAGKKSKDLHEKLGYYGERLVILAQALGLNTCWVALNYSKNSAKKHGNLKDGEKVVCVISLGYGKTQGVTHRFKNPEKLSKASGEIPEWYKKGFEMARYAPTALNQQQWRLTLKGDKVKAEALFGPYSKVDLGIVKYHFEVGSKKDSSIWE